MLLKNRTVKVSADLLVVNGVRHYIEPDKMETSKETGKQYGVYTVENALVVTEESDFASLEAFKHLDNACRTKYGEGFVSIANGQGLPLTATTFVQAKIKLATPNAKLIAMADRLAVKLGIDREEAIKMLTE